MLFNSVSYLIFFPVNVLLYFIIPYKYRNIFLLITSYYFYMSWVPQYAVLMLFSTVSTYLAAYAIDKATSQKARKAALAINIIINIGILIGFKYFNFFSSAIQNVLLFFGIQAKTITSTLLLPVGISFYTFQSLGYSIDAYRKNITHEKSFINYALFVSFFPQLVAGPIERATNLLPQFREKHEFEYNRVVVGLRLIAIGMFKKVAIADVVAIYVNQVFNNVTQYSGLTLLTAIFLFSIQIYCDFSGYSDIAVGSAKVLGFRLMENFKTPYLSSSITEFWSRWHISLCTWFKDYLYIPLGGNKKGLDRKLTNLFIVFLVSGLWHGANWTFIIWGVLHGVYRVCEEFAKMSIRPLEFNYKFLYKVKYVIKVIFTYSLVCFAWVFFRGNNIGDAFYVVSNMFADLSISQLICDTYIISSSVLGLTTFRYFYTISIIIFIVILIASDIYTAYKLKNQSTVMIFTNMRLTHRWLAYWLICISIVFYFIMQNGILGQTGQFIYFQF